MIVDFVIYFFACQNTFKRIAPLVELDSMVALANTHRFSSDHRYVLTDPNQRFIRLILSTHVSPFVINFFPQR